MEKNWDFDQRLRELERKAMFKKITKDMLIKIVPPLLLMIGSAGLVGALPGAAQEVAAGFLLAGSFLLMITGLME